MEQGRKMPTIDDLAKCVREKGHTDLADALIEGQKQLSKKLNKIKCSSCEYGKYLEHFDAWTCEHTECKDTVFFKGKTHPHVCPLVGGKNYYVHKNVKDRYDVHFKYW